MKKAKWHWADKEQAQEPSGDFGVRIPALSISAALVHSFAGLTLSLALAPIQHVLKDDYVTG